MYEKSKSHLTACPIFFMSTMPPVSVQRNEPTTIDTHRNPTWTNLVFLLVAVMLFLWRLARQLHMAVHTHEVQLRTSEAQQVSPRRFRITLKPCNPITNTWKIASSPFQFNVFFPEMVFRVTCGKKPTESSTVQAELVCFSSLILSIQIHVSFKVKNTSKQHKQKLWLGGHLLNLLTNSNHFITISI